MASADSRDVRTPQVLQEGRAIGQQARRLDARGQVDELPLDRLERRDRLAELRALEGVAARGFVGALRQADRQRRDADAARVEHLQRVDEALVLGAEQRVGRHAAVRGRSPRSCRWRACRACLPCGRRDIPGLPRSTMNAEMPRWPRALSVTAITTITSPMLPWVMNVLVPLITQPSPSRAADVADPRRVATRPSAR